MNSELLDSVLDHIHYLIEERYVDPTMNILRVSQFYIRVIKIHEKAFGTLFLVIKSLS